MASQTPGIDTAVFAPLSAIAHTTTVLRCNVLRHRSFPMPLVPSTISFVTGSMPFSPR